jgi:hypothetical protein
MVEAAIRVGVDTDWGVDVVQSQGRTLIVDGEANLVIGEILADGTPVAFNEPYPYEEEV